MFVFVFEGAREGHLEIKGQFARGLEKDIFCSDAINAD